LPTRSRYAAFKNPCLPLWRTADGIDIAPTEPTSPIATPIAEGKELKLKSKVKKKLIAADRKVQNQKWQGRWITERARRPRR
jgi:hypothetical protein